VRAAPWITVFINVAKAKSESATPAGLFLADREQQSSIILQRLKRANVA
jgi:hypothetical protein